MNSNSQTAENMKSVLLTVDVEDWFQVENHRKCFPLDSWSSCEMRVQKNTHLLLDFFDSMDVQNASGMTPRATFFVLGWVAERMPRLIREIRSRGHEIASHGFHHNLCYTQSRPDLRKDMAESKELLEDIIGEPIHGYRAPNFSISKDTLRIVEECGYLYDSSFNSFGINRRYGWIELPVHPVRGILYRLSDCLFELPVSNIHFGRCVLPLGGGGYFRLIPVEIFSRLVRFTLRKHHAYMFYMHPWEIDPDQPRVEGVSSLSSFRHRFNLGKALQKLERFVGNLRDCQFVTCSHYIRDGVLLGNAGI